MPFITRDLELIKVSIPVAWLQPAVALAALVDQIVPSCHISKTDSGSRTSYTLADTTDLLSVGTLDFARSKASAPLARATFHLM